MLSDNAIERIGGPIVRGPFGLLVDTRLDHVEEDRVIVRQPIRRELTNGAGIVHGGVTATLVDTAATAAAWATGRVTEKTKGTTVSLTINYLAPGCDGNLIAEAIVIQRGRNLTILEVEVTDDSGSKIAKAQVTYKIGL